MCLSLILFHKLGGVLLLNYIHQLITLVYVGETKFIGALDRWAIMM
jgi:hypothetical protein